MHHIVYWSRADANLTSAELVAILQQARAYNRQQGITGALVYGEDQFMQLLEGEEQAVNALYLRIAQDPRHREIVRLANKAVNERSFQEWSMAFAEVTAAQFEQLAGYVQPTEFEQHSLTGSLVDNLLLERMKELIRPLY